ncbi:MAG: hypothetical protein AAGC88_10820 [Bacteroidota bacterium]
MKQFLFYFSIVIFSIFLGSQITEGVLLVPYWKSLSANDFYAYYQQFGPLINRFYTVLTIAAALVPVAIAIYSKRYDPSGFKPALASTFFAVLFIACFYIYFKGANEFFFQAALSEEALVQELVTWGYWHWGRIVLEFAALIFLIVALVKMRR